jgi:hypothetical protein
MYGAWARRAERIEKRVDRGASALLAAACGYTAFSWLRFSANQPLRAAATAMAAVVAYFLSVRLLGAVKPAVRKVPVPIFDVRNVEPVEAEEAEAAEPLKASALSECITAKETSVEETSGESAPRANPEALILDDILAALGPDSRVVRLFDPKSMPTAGELQARIDQHLDGDATSAQTSDASQALHDALAELRRSIR